MIVYIGSFYLLLGSLFLLVPLIYLELGRPKDLVKAFLSLLIGFILITKNKDFNNLSFAILLLITILVVFYLVEIFSFRWNQLTDHEKNKITTYLEFKKNLSKITEAFTLGFSKFKNNLNFQKIKDADENINQKRWVRNDKNDKNDKI